MAVKHHGLDDRGAASDLELTKRCCQGDDNAWSTFIDRYSSSLAAAVEQVLRTYGQAHVPRETVEDLIEEVFLELVRDNYRALRVFEGRASLRTYLFVLAQRRCARFIASEHRHAKLTAFAEPTETAGSRPALEDLEAIAAALARLTPEERILVRAYYSNDSSYKDLSALTGLALNSVGPALARARAKLASFLPFEK
jgi:RNA polymerase sigma-70 factor (ECF subfamily)